MIKKLDGGIYDLRGMLSLGTDKEYVLLDAVGYDLDSLIKSGHYVLVTKNAPATRHSIESNKFIVRFVTKLFNEKEQGK